MKKATRQILLLSLALGARNAYAHHVKVMGMTLPHSVMSLPASLIMGIGAMFFFGWGLRQRKAVGAGFFAASLPLWLIAMNFIG